MLKLSKLSHWNDRNHHHNNRNASCCHEFDNKNKKIQSEIINTLNHENMISRIWHGYTTFDNADEYENLLKGRNICWY